MKEDVLLKEIRDLLVEIRDLLKGSSSFVGENVGIGNDLKKRGQSQESWEQHLKQKDPQNDYEIIALVVDRLISLGKKSVTKEEIVEFIRDNPDRINRAEDIGVSIVTTKSNTAYKYIEFVSKDDKTYRLSIKGKQMVKQLPERREKKNKRNKVK